MASIFGKIIQNNTRERDMILATNERTRKILASSIKYKGCKGIRLSSIA